MGGACLLLMVLRPVSDGAPGSIIAAMISIRSHPSLLRHGREDYGVASMCQATYIFLFILFGSFPNARAWIQMFHRCVARGLFVRTRGGQAKVAVLRSA